jgi:adenosylmethionine-8-amino-7-oxononanoate aminotransferase
MHSLFGPLLPRQLFAPRPPAGVDAPLQEEWAAAVRAIFERHGGELAAAIVEPIVQGAGGMWFYSPACLRLLRELCDSYGVLLVFDEIATGFGRSGTLFAADRAGVSPDVMCVGKALTGGYVTLAATLASAAVAARIEGPLMHGPTFMGNPLATAVALASLDLLESSDWRAAVARAEAVMTDALAPVAGIDGVRDVRVLGAIAVIETEAEVPLARASAAAIEAGVWLRPFRNLIYAMPPYVASEPELRAIAHAMAAAASVAVAPGAISP